MKYIIDIPNGVLWIQYVMPTPSGTQNLKSESVLQLEEYTEPDRKAIEDEVWNFARRIICPSDCCEDSISKYTEKFLGIPSHKARAIFKDLSYQEVKSKFEAWLKQKDFCIGDEIRTVDGDMGVVTFVYCDMCDCIWCDGSAGEVISKNELKKTGRHFDEIEELLKKMGEMKNNATHTKHSI